MLEMTPYQGCVTERLLGLTKRAHRKTSFHYKKIILKRYYKVMSSKMFPRMTNIYYFLFLTYYNYRKNSIFLTKCELLVLSEIPQDS